MNWVPEQPNAGSSLSLRQHYEAQSLGLVRAVWRQRRMIGMLVAAALVVASAISLTLPERYTAETLIQVDLGRSLAPQVGQPAQAPSANLDAAAIVESEARVIRSRAIARRVAQDLRLADDPDFARPGLLSRLLGRDPAEADSDQAARTNERIATVLARNLGVTNDARAYLISVTYTDGDPERAARIANGFVEAYQRNRLEIGVADAERVSTWLEAQVRATRRALDQAEAEVEHYRREAQFVEGAAGTNLPQQALQDAQGRLAAAGQARLAAEARLARAQEIFAGGGVPSAQDLVGAPVIQRLLEGVETARREVGALAAAGPRHPRLVQAQGALADAQERLRQEVDRAIGNLQSEVRSAAAEEETTAARVEVLKAAAIGEMGREAKLRSLQAAALSVRDRLKLLNDGHAQAIALAGVKSSAVQVVMQAQPSPTPSSPNRPLIIGLAAVGAAVAGIAGALLLARRDTGFRSGTEVAEFTALRCLSMVPAITADSDAPAMRMFDEAIRLVAAGLGWSRSPATAQVLLVASALPGEGKSLLCMALAQSLAGRGTRTLVIDAAAPACGEADGRGSLRSVVLGDPAGFLESVQERRVVRLRGGGWPEAGDLLGGEGFERFLTLARARFDLVLIEAPPAMLVLDVVHLAHLSDAVVLAVRWGATPRRTVLAALRRLQDLSVRVRGIVLTEVDLDEHRHDRFADQCGHYAEHRAFFAQGAALARIARDDTPAPDAKPTQPARAESPAPTRVEPAARRPAAPVPPESRPLPSATRTA